jgi:nucleoprotein TPR
LQASNRRHIEIGKKNNEIMKRRIAGADAEKAELVNQVEQLRAELTALTAELDALRSQPQTGSSREQELTTQLEALQKEKIALEGQIAQLQAATAAAVSSVPDAELAAKLVRLICSLLEH